MPNNCRKHLAAGYHDQNTSNLYNRTTYIVQHNRTTTSSRNLIIHKCRNPILPHDYRVDYHDRTPHQYNRATYIV